jgi:hypothetical protein
MIKIFPQIINNKNINNNNNNNKNNNININNSNSNSYINSNSNSLYSIIRINYSVYLINLDILFMKLST